MRYVGTRRLPAPQARSETHSQMPLNAFVLVTTLHEVDKLARDQIPEHRPQRLCESGYEPETACTVRCTAATSVPVRPEQRPACDAPNNGAALLCKEIPHGIIAACALLPLLLLLGSKRLIGLICIVTPDVVSGRPRNPPHSPRSPSVKPIAAATFAPTPFGTVIRDRSIPSV